MAAQDSVRAAFGTARQAGVSLVTICGTAMPHAYTIHVDGASVGVIFGKERCADFTVSLRVRDELLTKKVGNLKTLIWDLSSGYSAEEVFRAL